MKARCHSHHNYYFVNSLLALGDIIQTALEFQILISGKVISLELARPSSWPTRAVYYLHLLRIALHIGGLISGRKGAYTYLPKSILEFPSPEEVKKIMQGQVCKRLKPTT